MNPSEDKWKSLQASGGQATSKSNIAPQNLIQMTDYKRPTVVADVAVNKNGSPIKKVNNNVGQSITTMASTAAQTLGESLFSTGKNLYKFGKLVYDVNPLTQINPLTANYRYQAAQDAKRAYDSMVNTTETYKRSYERGNVTKEDYGKAVKNAQDAYIKASKRIISTEIPNSKEDIVNLVDGAITASSLGVFAAGKFGVQAGAKAAIGTTKKMVANRIALAEAAQTAKGFTVAQKSNLLKNAAPTMSEAMRINIDNAISAVPALNTSYNSLLRKMGTSETAKGFAKNVIIEVAFWSPMRRENIRFVQDTIDNFREQNWFADENKMGAIPSSVLLAGMLLEGGPIGWLYKNAGKAGSALKKASYGENEIFDLLNDSLVREAGMTGNIPAAIVRKIAQAKDPASKKLYETYAKQIIGTELKKGPAIRQADIMKDHIVDIWKKSGGDITKMTADDVVDNMFRHAEADNVLAEVRGLGISATAAKFSQQEVTQITNKIKVALRDAKIGPRKGADGKLMVEEAKKVARSIIAAEVDNGAYWAQSADIVNQLLNSIDNAKSLQNVKLSANTIDAFKEVSDRLISKAGKQKMKELGYVPIIAENASFVGRISPQEAQNIVLKSKYTPVDDVVFQQAATALPVFRTVGAALTRAGLGLDDSAALGYKLVRDNIVQNVDQSLNVKNGKQILNKLQQSLDTANENRFADLVPGNWSEIKKRTATDLRMMSNGQIIDALKGSGLVDNDKLTTKFASNLRKAIIDGHVSAPMQAIGLADALTSRAYKYTGNFYGTYARIQGALRYTYNPFFAVQEITETIIGSQAVKPGMVKGLGRGRDKTVKLLNDMGFFNNSTLASSEIGQSLMSTRFGEGAQDVYVGRVSAILNKTQKRTLADTVERIADSMGLSVEDALRMHGGMIEDLVRPIVQYPTTGALASNAAKMLNIAMFPSRYNLKVTNMAVKALAQAHPSVQMATVNKLWEFQNWIRTPQGIAWQQDNSTAIQFFKWVTPLGSIQWTFDTLSTAFGKGHQSLADFGVIGGLPFGVIGQILESQGLFTLNTPYVNPTTGDIYARKIPDSIKAKMASALMDLLGSVFTYPGATIGLTQVGLPSKSGMLRWMASVVALDTKYKDWKRVEYTPEDLPEYDKTRQEIWAERYSLESGQKNKYETADIAPTLQDVDTGFKTNTPQRSFNIPQGKILSSKELRELKNAQADAKAASKLASKKKKTTSFPGYLPR